MNSLKSIKESTEKYFFAPVEAVETCGLHKENLFEFPDGEKICYSCRKEKIEFDYESMARKIVQKANQVYL